MRILKKHLVIFAVVGMFYAVSLVSGVTCPIKYITKVPCPTCGTTRAMLALVRLDIKGYLEYNPMALFMIVAVLLCIHRNVFKKKKWIHWFTGIVLIVNLVVYITQFI